MTPRTSLLALAFLAAFSALASLASYVNNRWNLIETFPEDGDMP